jgi:DNA-binding IclR family transcriptional regulator
MPTQEAPARGAAAATSVRAIERALAVLTCFSLEAPELSLGVVSQRIGLPRSTTHRLLATLLHTGFVRRATTPGCYRLGPKALTVGSVAQRTLLVGPVVQRELDTARIATGETVALSTLVGDQLLMLAKSETEEALRTSLPAGKTAPAYCIAGGKALLAELSDDDVGDLFREGFAELPTTRTLRSLEELLSELAVIRAQGYAVDDEEWTIGLRAVAVPIRGPNGPVDYAISVCAPTARMSLEELVGELAPLRRAAEEIASSLEGSRPAGRQGRRNGGRAQP